MIGRPFSSLHAHCDGQAVIVNKLENPVRKCRLVSVWDKKSRLLIHHDLSHSSRIIRHNRKPAGLGLSDAAAERFLMGCVDKDIVGQHLMSGITGVRIQVAHLGQPKGSDPLFQITSVAGWPVESAADDVEFDGVM